MPSAAMCGLDVGSVCRFVVYSFARADIGAFLGRLQ
jgi:hypothetical protein